MPRFVITVAPSRKMRTIDDRKPAYDKMFEAFLISSGVVALAEIGDKTQLLALVLAAKFRKPIPIVFGILVATLLNHTIAGAIGAWIAHVVDPDWMRWILGASFIGMAVWTLIPDKYEEQNASPPRFGVFVTTLIAFFLVEIGDKTQIATAALAAKYQMLLPVVAGTTLGMMIADVPAVWIGEVAATKLPLKWVRGVAAGIFVILGLLVLININVDLS
jgi:putative Ca2+/H+ antiporter (TMEM165/GDT1 family)